MSDILSGGGGTVRVADRDVLIAPLSVEGENRLIRALQALARKQLGPEGRVGKVAASARSLLASGDVELARMVIAEAVRGDIADVRPSPAFVAMETVRTPEGVALELFHRTRLTHPDRTLAEFEALVTDANAGDVYESIRESLGEGESDPKAGASAA